jgi:hypothetical protein
MADYDDVSFDDVAAANIDDSEFSTCVSLQRPKIIPDAPSGAARLLAFDKKRRSSSPSPSDSGKHAL